MGRPAKRAKLIDDADEAAGDDTILNINDEYARRFQHNKAREERQRLEEKYGKDGDDDEDSSSDEEEDSEAELVTNELDDQIFETLNAIRSRDPRIYDSKTTFFTAEEASAAAAASKKEKPVYLQDYHRKNLLSGPANGDVEDEDVPMTYADEQAAAKRDLLAQARDAGSDNDDDDFMVAKPGQVKLEPLPPKRAAKVAPVDPATADRDPEAFLNNFMAAKAWKSGGNANFDAFESEDESDVDRAEQWEAAYNMRFEDPAKANEKLLSHSRDAAAKYSVRREELTGRKKARELEKDRKAAQKAERDSDKARLRRLKIEEAQEKLQKFREAAGLARGDKDVSVEEWAKFLEAGFEDENWDEEMAKRFGDDYYEDGEDGGEADEDEDEQAASSKKKSKLKKPKWDDELDIADLVPDFDPEEEKKGISLTDEEDAADEDGDDDGGAEGAEDESGVALETKPMMKPKDKKKAREDARLDARRQARKDRAKIEELVDAQLTTATAPTTRFRYRETSPTTYGLSSLDILMADDAHLNAYAGLKKLAAFRDVEKKRKDKKKLGKKARLREWRREAFGKEDEPATEEFENWFNELRGAEAKKAFAQHQREEGEAREAAVSRADGEGDVVEGKRKNKRSRKKKSAAVQEDVAAQQ